MVVPEQDTKDIKDARDIRDTRDGFGRDGGLAVRWARCEIRFFLKTQMYVH